MYKQREKFAFLRIFTLEIRLHLKFHEKNVSSMRYLNSGGNYPPYKLKIEKIVHLSEVALTKSTTISKKPPTEVTKSTTGVTMREFIP